MTEAETEAEKLTERVTMLWPVDLKERVREVAGSRGMTEFTVAAVRTKLLTVRKAPARPTETKKKKPAKKPAAKKVEKPKPEKGPELESGQPWADKSVDLYERVTAKSKELGVDLGEANLKPASTLPSKPKKATKPKTVTLPETVTACPKCGNALVNGECWECF